METVPANHLKFYLHFPAPMERGEVFRHLRLVEIDRKGEEVAEVPEPFREVELWDGTFTRMTLWFHPGRQKPGVNLNVEIGPILEEGKRYRLEISPEWRTETGETLDGNLAHEFEAGPFDDKQPDPMLWESATSVNENREPVVLVHTVEPLDPVSAKRRIRIFAGDEPVDFDIRGSQLSFASRASGAEGFRIVIDPALEDLAGNSIARPFNLDLGEDPDFEERSESIVLEFPRKIDLPANPGSQGKGDL